jgi:hypothetical protein
MSLPRIATRCYQQDAVLEGVVYRIADQIAVSLAAKTHTDYVRASLCGPQDASGYTRETAVAVSVQHLDCRNAAVRRYTNPAYVVSLHGNDASHVRAVAVVVLAR